jgi:DNA polymerase-3 subunit alpha
LKQVSDILQNGGVGRGRVAFILTLEGDSKEVELDLAKTYNISPEIRQAIKYVPGVVDVHDI